MTLGVNRGDRPDDPNNRLSAGNTIFIHRIGGDDLYNNILLSLGNNGFLLINYASIIMCWRFDHFKVSETIMNEDILIFF